MSTMARVAVSRRVNQSVAAVVASALVASSLAIPARAQVARSAGPGGAQHLIINILEGEGALNNIRQRDAREPVVQVTDENHKPVAGVALVFLIHGGKSGASATFGTNSLTFSTTTDAQGIAHATGLHLGAHPGSITISVTASVGSMVVATTVIHQSNVITALSSTTASSTTASSTSGSTAGSTAVHHGLLHLLTTPKGLIVGGVVVAGAVAGIVVAVKAGGSTDITLGGATVGHP